MAQSAVKPQGDSKDFARIYSEFASGLRFADLSDATVAAVGVNLFDTLSCTFAGFLAEGAREVRELVIDWGGKPEAAILGTRHKVPAPNAAWINGIMSHARDYDDTHDQAIIHVGVSAIPAALAAVDLAGRPVSGEEFYAAVAAGIELNSRMAVATQIGVIDSGFIYSSLFGYFGATAAAARVLGMEPEAMQNAMGIAYSQAAGGHQATRDAAWTKRMQPGFAARAGLTSVAMGLKGVRGARDIFEGEDGLWRIYLRNEFDREALGAGLGSRWHLEDLSYKPYPCCRYNHTAIDAAKKIRAQAGFDWRKVTEIRTYTTQQCYSAIGTPLEVRRAPETLPQAQFSICYNVATALVQGEVSLADYAAVAALKRPDIARLTAMVTPHVDPEIEREWGRSVSPTRLEVVCGDTIHTARVDEAKGSKANPFTPEDTRRKLEDSLHFGGFDRKFADLYEDVMAGLPASGDVAADFARLNAALAG